ncbi:MAG: XdhC family protein [Phaeodactylibacter sp.]|nr:XdhC family protein [Phaeodactylibacter sp.]
MKEIRNIITSYDTTDWSKEQAALATVVNVEASAYRRIGARMFVRSSGTWIGGISGGCLEGDALRRAQAAIFKNTPTVVVYDTMDDDDHQIGVGLGCNGRIEVLFTPINPNDPNNPVEVLRKLVESRSPSVLVQAVASPEQEDLLNGSLFNALEVETIADFFQLRPADIQESVQKIKDRKKSKVYALQNKQGHEIELLFEWLRPEMRLFVVGDNYDVNAFAGISEALGWELHLIGTLRKFDKSLFRIAKSIQSYDEVSQLNPDPYTAVILMSHDYKWDMKMVQYFLPLKPVYMGMLGPKKRMEKMHDELKDKHPEIDLANYVRLYSPVGLDIGAESPEEIALSIAAEIVSVFRNREGSSLRLRRGPIHES